MDPDFTREIFEKLLKSGKITKSDSILVVGGLGAERDFFSNLSFRNVTISNIAKDNENAMLPFDYVQQDMNHLSFPDASFDFVFVSASLHHCSSPVGGFLEMYRVARKGTIVVESRDSLLMRSAQRIGLIPNYEISAVRHNKSLNGGVDNTNIPNYVFRWSERDFKRLVSSFNPMGPHEFIFLYKFNPYLDQIAGVDSDKIEYLSLKVAVLLIKPFMFFLKNQRNLFGVVILKPRLPQDLFPWLKIEMKSGKIVFNSEYKGVYG